MSIVLTKIIKEAIEEDRAYLILIKGPQGSGKTSLGLKTMHRIYENWGKVFYNLHFEPIDYLEQNSGKNEIIMFDDAGLWIPRELWYEKDKIRLGQLFNVTRNIANAVLFTMPSEELPSYLNRKLNYKVVVYKACPSSLKGMYKHPACGVVYELTYSDVFSRVFLKNTARLAWEKWYPNEVFKVYSMLREVKVLKYKAMASLQMKEMEIAKTIIKELNEKITEYSDKASIILKDLGSGDKEIKDLVRKFNNSSIKELQ